MWECQCHDIAGADAGLTQGGRRTLDRGPKAPERERFPAGRQKHDRVWCFDRARLKILQAVCVSGLAQASVQAQV